MQLQAVLVPPSDVVRDALEGAHELFPSTSGAAPELTSGLLGRLLGRRRSAPPGASGVTTVPAAPEAVFVRLAKIGNIEASDAAVFSKGIEVAARTWRTPTLHVSKVAVATAHPFDVVAQLDGDLDALMDIFRNVNEIARLQRIFLDRRSFRTEFPLGSLQAEDGATFPAHLMGAETLHDGLRWSPSHITILRTSFTGGQTSFAEFARFDLAHTAEPIGVRASA